MILASTESGSRFRSARACRVIHICHRSCELSRIEAECSSWVDSTADSRKVASAGDAAESSAWGHTVRESVTAEDSDRGTGWAAGGTPGSWCGCLWRKDRPTNVDGVHRCLHVTSTWGAWGIAGNGTRGRRWLL